MWRSQFLMFLLLIGFWGPNVGASLWGQPFASELAALQDMLAKNEAGPAEELLWDLAPKLDAQELNASTYLAYSEVTKGFAYLDILSEALPRLELLASAPHLLDSLELDYSVKARINMAKTYFWVGGSVAKAKKIIKGAATQLESAQAIKSESGYEVLRVLANCYLTEGDIAQVVALYLRLIQIDQDIAEPSIRSGQLQFWLGGYYQNMGRFPEALAAFQAAEAIFSVQNAPLYHFAYLENALGNMQEGRGNLQASLSYYFKALELFAMAGITNYNTANVNMNVANILRRLDRTDSALVFGHRAVSIYDANPSPIVQQSRAHMYHDLSRIYSVRKEFRPALALIQKGFNILDPSYDTLDVAQLPRHLEGEDGFVEIYLLNAKASCLANLAGSDSSRTDWMDLAMEHLRQNLNLIDSVREAHFFPGNIDAFRNISVNCYESAVAISLRTHAETGEESYLSQAFNWVEKSRAYQLQSDLFRIRARPYTFYPDSLLRLEEQIQAEIKGLERRLQENEDEQNGSNVIGERIYALSNQVSQIHAEIRAEYPDFIRFQQTQEIASLKDLLAAYPGAGVVRFYHNQLDEVIYAFYAGPGGEVSVLYCTKPETREILDEVERYVNLLQSREDAANRGFDSSLVMEHQQLGYALYQQLLAPVLDSLRLESGTPLLIIPDNKLGYLPFEALVTEDAPVVHEWRNLAYLLKKHPVYYAFSASTAIPIQTSNGDMGRRLLGVAPTYAGLEWPQLAYNTREVELIQKRFQGDNLLGEAATEAGLKESAGKYDLLHIASHAFIDPENPYYSGLVLLPDQAQSQDADQDGILHAYEISNLNLKAQLVTLSGCETGAGKLKQGEGIMSLARAFRAAGCAHVVMSHWPAEDLATAQLMDNFYGYLHRGTPIAQALQQAKLDFLQSQDALHPFFWNNFVLIGGSPVQAGPTSNNILWGLIFCLIGLAIWGGVRRRRNRKGTKPI